MDFVWFLMSATENDYSSTVDELVSNAGKWNLPKKTGSILKCYKRDLHSASYINLHSKCFLR